jgi:primary-amine oxidase
MVRRIASAILPLAFVSSALAQTPMATAVHPLDHLTPAEHWTVYETLRASGRTDSTLVIAYVALHEPPKSEVLGWKKGQPFRREATVHLINGGKGYEAVLDLRARSVLSWRDTPGQYYMVNSRDDAAVAGLMLGDERVRAALTRRGVTDFTHIGCFWINQGGFERPEELGNRVMRAVCWDNRGTFSGWGNIFAGLVGVVDLTNGRVLRVIDEDPIPLARETGEYAADVIGATRDMKTPLMVMQPMGAGFTLDGQSVSWQNWRFHFRVDPRRGLVLSLVKWADVSEDRMVAYQMSVSELFVPYSDPNEPFNYQAYFDLGSYTNFFGGIASTMDPGGDCPDNAKYFDAVVATELGKPVQRVRAACLFERLTGDAAWRHSRDKNLVTDARPRRDLVLRMAMTAGNYDYIFDYVFMQDGAIEVRVGASGMDQTRTVRTPAARVIAQKSREDGGVRNELHGRMIAPNLVGIHHSHFLAFRLDLDVDGQTNTLAVDRIVTERLPAGNPRKSIWNTQTLMAGNESEAMRMSTMDKPEAWRIVNPNKAGAYGDVVGYEITGGHLVSTMLSEDDFVRRRGGFTEHMLWTTPYDPAQLYAAGDYPTGNPAVDGLPAWTKANRRIDNTDIVAWYTMGFHHIPRPEDWPIMPVSWHSFRLQPVGFFKRNPALDLPK